MKNRISLAIFLLIISLYSWAQIGGDYNPTNPSDPGNPAQEYTLTLKATPSNSGSFNTTSTNIAGGKTYTLQAYPSTDFAFLAWLCNGDTLSKSPSYTYTMPYHDVEIIGVFTYSPSNPSDPNVVAQKYTLTMKATPSDGGSFNTTNTRVSVGERYNLRAYPNTDFAFVAWLCEGDTLSKSASYDYTMPSHNVDITGVFTYRPSSPSDPQEQALKYQLSLTAVPMNSGSFNISNERLAVGSNNSLRAYANTDFVFKHWMIGDSVLSTNPNLDFIMPSHNVQMVGVFEYNPANPANPNANYWNKLTGEVIVDDFTAGYLSSAISTVISGSSSNDVQMITVSGRINSNDLGVANNYKNCSLLDLSRVTGVTEVPSYAFDYTDLETIYLSATIEKIGYRAFAECTKLSSLTIYAMTPPTLESQVFQGVPDGLVVYVPAAAIAQYQDDEAWGKFTLLPIQEDIRSISISLPEGTNAQDYAQMWLELTNTKSGQRMHYVMTDRQTYTFANIIRNTLWNVTLRNERGDVFGQIENVEVKDEDVTVTFASLSKPQNVSLSVLTPDGNDVTNQVQVTWTDAHGNYVAQGASLSGLPVGYQVNYRMALSQELAMTYDTPSAVEYTLKDGSNALTCQLQAIKKLTLSGKVKDATTGLPLSGTVISASQTFSGKYSKTLNAKTDGNGVFTMEIFNVPTSVAIAATDYVSQTIDYSNNDFNGLNEFAIPDVSLKSITGATISVGFTYTTVEGETQNWYSDYQNVSYTLYNSTREKPITQFNVQYPQIVLLEEVEDGDVLRLTATSRTNAFKTVEATATIAEQKAETMFAITELGRIEASFSKTGNASVVGSLYDAFGKLVKTYNFSEAKLTINDLADGNYTLVSMGSSRLYNTIYDLAQLPQTGLAEGTDYVQNAVEVKSGVVSTISIEEVPTLDESKLYYTGDNTSFTVNKPSIVAGNYLTLTGRIDFKPAYATNVSNVQMVVDLPESCEFVENSVMVGNSTSSYTFNGHQITIPMARYTDRVRFCIIPTLGGDYTPSAFVQFDLDGETVTQPIGSANYTAKDLSISVPSTVAKTAIPVSGTAIGTSTVEIYDNGVLIGQTTSLANGTWATTCELNEPFNLSAHSISAKVLTKTGIILQTETIECLFDRNAIEVKTVTMINTAHPASSLNTCEYVTVFDFQNPTSNIPAYWYWPNYPDFTFLIDFTNNDTTVVSNVTLHVKLSNNTIARLKPIYEKSKGLWIVSNKFYSNALPKNVSVTFDTFGEAIVDRSEIDTKYQNVDDIKNYYVNLTNALNDSIAAIALQESAYNELLEKLDSISNSISQATDENSENELWKQYFMLTGHEELIDSMQADCPKVITPEYQQALLARIDSLLSNDVIAPNETEWNSFVQTVDELLDDNHNIVDFEASVATLHDTEYCWSDNQVERIMQKLPISEIDLTQFDGAELTSVNTSDGNQILIGANERMMVWIDTSCDSAWVITDNKLASEVRGIMRRAKDSPDMLWTIVEKIKFAWGRAMDIITPLCENIKKQFNNLQVEIDACDYYKNINNQRGIECQKEIARIQKELNNMTRSVPAVEDHFASNQRMLKERLEVLRKSYKGFKKQAEEAAAKQAKLKIKWAKLGAVLGTITDIINLGSNIQQLISQIIDGKQDWDRWCDFINNILPCEAAESQAISIKKASESDRNVILAKYIGCGSATAAAIGGTIYLMTNKAAGAIVKLVFGSISDILSTYSNKFFSAIKKDSSLKLSNRKRERKRLKCRIDDNNNDDEYENDGNNGDDDGDSGNGDVGHVMDPSGYVYEGVASNRIEGVTATAYYKEMVEDMYGDLHENIVKWDAEEYAQENPLFTDEYGMYAWDVPNGLWQVKFEKEGYETTYSEWLPVPPPQLDVNIAMKQNRQPEVKTARAYEDAVEVEFDKYMMPELLTTENIMVMQNGTAVEGTVELLNEEVSYEGETETFASKIRFNAAQPFTEQEITLMVSNRVKSYAGIRMQDNYQQTFAIEQEIKQIVCDSAMTVVYGDTEDIVVEVKPASAAVGKRLLVKSSSPMILSTESDDIIIGDDGKVKLAVNGELPGTASLTYSIDGYDMSAMTMVSVGEDVSMVTAKPLANIASGVIVDTGTQIVLTCKTQGATIYYTTDGSCPCDEETRKVYDGTPITINKNTVIRTMAVASGKEESEVVQFEYVVTPGDLNFDTRINGMDIVEMVTLIMDKGYMRAADLYPVTIPDGIINGMDLVQEVEVVMSQSSSSNALAKGAITEKRMTLNDGTAGVKTLGIDAQEQFILAQMMIELSDGMTLNDITSDKFHTVAYRKLDGKKFVVVCYSKRNAAFESNRSVMSIHYTGDGDMSINNILLIDTDKNECRGTDILYGQTTGINDVSAPVETFDVYAPDGRVVKHNATTTKGLSKGVYIINNQKVSIK